MGLLENFFDPTERQRRKLEGLRTKRGDLARDHAAAVVAGDEAAEAKAWAALGKLDAEIRGAESALAVAQSAADHDAAAAAAEAKRVAVEAAEQATQRYEAAAIAFERAALAVAPVLRDLETAEQAMREARSYAGVPASPGIGGFLVAHVWDRAMVALGREVHRQLPTVSSWSRPHETVEQVFARKADAARPWQAAAPEAH